MYDQNFKNQAVKEVKNGSSVSATAKKFDISISALKGWINQYDEKMFEMTRAHDIEAGPVVSTETDSIRLHSIKVLISGNIVTLKRKDVIDMLKIFDTFK